MDVNFILPDSISSGVTFQVPVTVRHAAIGSTVTVELTEPIGMPPIWPGAAKHAVVTAPVPGAADASVTFVFDVTLGAPGRAHLCATARDTAGGFDVHAEHAEVV